MLMQTTSVHIYIALAFQDFSLHHVGKAKSSSSTPHCSTKQSTHWKMDHKLLLLLNYTCPDVSWVHGVPFHALNYAPGKYQQPSNQIFTVDISESDSKNISKTTVNLHLFGYMNSLEGKHHRRKKKKEQKGGQPMYLSLEFMSIFRISNSILYQVLFRHRHRIYIRNHFRNKLSEYVRTFRK